MDPGESQENWASVLRDLPVFDFDRLPEVAAGTPILADESNAIMRVTDKLARQVHPKADCYLVGSNEIEVRISAGAAEAA